MSPDRTVGFIMPVYNEERILRDELESLVDYLRTIGIDFEILVIENGSTDRTPEILSQLEREYSVIDVHHIGPANVGLAKKTGLKLTPHNWNFIVHADFWDPQFIQRSLELLSDYAFVQSSKCLPESTDDRGWFRCLLTRGYSFLVRWLVGYDGSDSRGIKALRKDDIQSVLEKCVFERGMFETELVVRCQKEGIPVKEIPADVVGKRASRNFMIKKISQNVWDLVQFSIHMNIDYSWLD